MKEPKTFKYPRLYMRDNYNGGAYISEAIIVYPDGRKAERTSILSSTFSNSISISFIACWYREGMTPQRQVQAMKQYSKKYGYKTIFIGEIK